MTKNLQLQPRYRVEIIEPKQVYLLSEQSTHALTGRLYCQILPLLDGQNSLEEIYQKLNGEVEPDHINYVLNRLNEKGYLTEAAPELSPDVAAFWSALNVSPTLAAEALQQSERCLLFSDRQYINRETLNEQATVAHDWIPQQFNDSLAIDWTPVWSLTEQTHKYLPTAFCYYDYPLSKDHRFCKADSNGNAAGNTLEEAILQGFMELVERDSVALWWYNRLQHPAVDLSSFDEPYFLELQQFYQENNRELWVLDLTADLGIPAFAGVSRRLGEGSQRIIAGYGAHLDPTIAILRAITEKGREFESLHLLSGG